MRLSQFKRLCRNPRALQPSTHLWTFVSFTTLQNRWQTTQLAISRPVPHFCKQTCLNATYETGAILPPCGEYVFPNCTDAHQTAQSGPFPSFEITNPNVSCIFRCDADVQYFDIPPVILSPSVVKSFNPYDVQISIQTGKITFVTVDQSYPLSSSDLTQILKPFATVPNVSPIDLNVLNTFFHPLGSGTFPSVDINRIVFVGPGAPPVFMHRLSTRGSSCCLQRS
jgi:hypothetical protein